MTAPAPLSGGDARTQLAEVLFAAKQAYDGDFYVVAWEDNYARDEWYALADALLSVVQRIADERAAEALEAVAAELVRDGRPDLTTIAEVEAVSTTADLLDARAASLRAASRGEAAR